MRLFDLKSLSVSRKSSSSPTCLKGRLAPVSHVSCLGVWESVSAGQSRAERDIKRERERERETRELDFDWKNAKKRVRFAPSTTQTPTAIKAYELCQVSLISVPDQSHRKRECFMLDWLYSFLANNRLLWLQMSSALFILWSLF